MPLTRYQIRNEYSLADPELYRAADKDDPEALLEGVAMAGLVGVLRQLGDLAEFAAEIFHDLHEEVMATAARGHGLMVRVQQLETDFPSIEKAFLSQISPSLFFYDPGVEWHPNLRMDQNLITQGDLPRFVMDSYEECRGPPRLFLLDKFDVAGAGACLKRYTDPSFFKVESSSSGMTKAEVHREKKTRKTKKKGSRWRNGQTPEILPTSHAKLHQLFLEESIENYVNDPARRVKLKRRLNGFPFDTKTGKSYMEKLFNNPTPDHNVRDISVNSSPLRLPSNINSESGIDILEISTANPGKELPWRKRSPFLSPDAKKTAQKPSMAELNEEFDYGISEVPSPNPISEADNGHGDGDKKEMAANRPWKIEGSLDSYQSDDVASEVENYMDALTTMDSEMETDNECRAKNNLHMNMKNLGMKSDANVELQDIQAHFSDSQSIGNSTATDDENSSSRKGLSSFSGSDSLSNSAENAQSDGGVSANILPSSGTCEAESVNVSFDQTAERMVSNGVCTEECSSCLTDSTILPVNPGKSSMEGESVGLESDEICSDPKKLNAGYHHPEENTQYHGDNLPGTSDCSDDPSQTRYDFLPELFSENNSLYELDNEDSHVSSHSSAKKSRGTSFDDVVQTEYAEDECPETSVDNQIESSHSVALQDKLLDSSLPELESCCPEIKPDGMVSDADDAPPLAGQIKISSIPVVYSPHATDFTKQQFPGISEHIPSLELDSADVGFIYCGEKNIDDEKNVDEASDAADVEGMGGSPNDMHIFAEEAADLEFSSDLQKSPDPPSVPDVHLDDITTEAVHSDAVTVDENVAGTHFDYNGGDGKALSGSPTKLQEESIFIVQDLHVDVLEINKSCSEEHLQESNSEKVADQQGVASLFFNSVLGSTFSCDDSNSEVLNHVPDSVLAVPSSRSLQTVDATTVPLALDQHSQQPESNPAQEINFIQDAEDGVSSYSCHIAELRPPLEQKFDLRDDQFDVASRRDQDDGQTVNAIPTNSLPTVDASTVRLFSDQHDQLSESKHSQQINSVEDAEDDVSSYDCHIAELRPPLEEKLDVQDNENHVASCCGQDAESKSSLGIIVVENVEDVSSPTHHTVELQTTLEQKSEKDHHFDAEPFHSVKARSNPVMDLIQSPNQADASSRFCAAHLPSESLVLPQIDVSKKAKELSFSALPSFGQLPDLSQINSDEMPPLPPLPPMQWRMGKVQHASLASKRDLGGHNVGPSTADENTQLGHLGIVEDNAQPSNPVLPLSALEGENSLHCYENFAGYMVHSNPLSLEDTNGDRDIPASGRPQSTDLFLVRPTLCGERSEHGFAASEGETARPGKNPSSPETKDVILKYPSKSLPEELDHPLHQSPPERSLEDEKLQGASVIPERKVISPLETTFPTPMMQDDQLQNFSSLSGEQNPWSLSTSVPLPSFEDGEPNGNRPTKLPRPRNPLIDAVVAHDKSKLRKVKERVQPHTEHKIEERDSLLEQIRTKSFNLRPAVLTRPSIQGPKTNLKVAAILQKANAIRQAFAGSDEDDDADSWSDA